MMIMNLKFQRLQLKSWTTGALTKEVQKVKLTLSDQNAAADVSFWIGLYNAKSGK